MAAFDTSFLVDLLRSRPRAVAMLDRIEENGEAQIAPAPAVFELAVELGRRRTPPARARRLAAAIGEFEVASFTVKMALRAGRISGELEDAGVPIEDADCMVAATAIELGERLVTRNVQHFQRIPGLRVAAY